MSETPAAPKRAQKNIRLDAEMTDLFERLGPPLRKAKGIPVTDTDIVRLGLLVLAAEYLPEKSGRKSAKSP